MQDPRVRQRTYQYINQRQQAFVHELSMPSNTQLPLIPTVIAVSVGFIGCLLFVKRNNSGHIQKEDKQEDTTNNNPMNFSVSDTLKVIQTRRTIFPQQYTGQSIPQEVIYDMLEAARWAPTHKLTEPWRFIIFHSDAARKDLGLYLATQYKNETPEDKFVQAKFEKKAASVERSSCVIALCVQLPSKAENPLIEEICSVAMAVQNMHLVATAYGVGAYWSTGGIYGNFDKDMYHLIPNPSCLKEFLKLENQLCIGWFYVGAYFGNMGSTNPKCWPTGRRKPMDDGARAVWR